MREELEKHRVLFVALRKTCRKFMAVAFYLLTLNPSLLRKYAVFTRGGGEDVEGG